VFKRRGFLLGGDVVQKKKKEPPGGGLFKKKEKKGFDKKGGTLDFPEFRGGKNPHTKKNN